MDSEHLTDNTVTLCNDNGVRAVFSCYGARWIAMCVPDREGRVEDVLLGFDHLNDYKTATESYYGAIIGRVCGRISNAEFRINGTLYKLAPNDIYGHPIRNHLHGGIAGFHCQLWQKMQYKNKDGEESVSFTYLSKDGEEGYPGNLNVSVTYTLTNDNALLMECKAVADQCTPVNLTNHAFFNLHGVDRGKNILSHRLTIPSWHIIECDEELVPTGTIVSVKNTLLDFSKSRLIGEAVKCEQMGIHTNNGFSLAYALDTNCGLPLIAELYEEQNGRTMQIFSNQPSLQVYTGYLMNGTDIGKKGVRYSVSAGVALEPQGYPDAVHQSNFPSVLLKPGDMYVHRSLYRFTTQ